MESRPRLSPTPHLVPSRLKRVVVEAQVTPRAAGRVTSAQILKHLKSLGQLHPDADPGTSFQAARLALRKVKTLDHPKFLKFFVDFRSKLEQSHEPRRLPG